MRYRRPSRVRGFDYLGMHRYSLRYCTFQRRRLFVSAAIVESALAQIQLTAREDQFAVIAYCFMPDHVHLALQGEAEHSDLRRFVKVSKQRIAHALRSAYGLRDVWQEGYYERVLRSDEATLVVVRYILDNPVRAGMVERFDRYAFSGSMYPAETL